MDDAYQAVIAVLGPFAGAGTAFLLQNVRETRKRDQDRYEAIIRAQHAIYFMWLILARIRYRYLDAGRENENRHRLLPIHWVPDHRVPLDFATLAFLHKFGSGALLTQLFMAERAYISAGEALRDRNDRFQQMFPSWGTDVVFDPQTKLAHAPIDPIKDSMLKSSTDALYGAVDGGMKVCELAFSELRVAAKKAFPKRTGFLKAENLTRAGFDAAHGRPPRESAA